jgi:hypothetical protein
MEWNLRNNVTTLQDIHLFLSIIARIKLEDIDDGVNLVTNKKKEVLLVKWNWEGLTLTAEESTNT